MWEMTRTDWVGASDVLGVARISACHFALHAMPCAHDVAALVLGVRLHGNAPRRK
jgi:hypothetical protein